MLTDSVNKMYLPYLVFGPQGISFIKMWDAVTHYFNSEEGRNQINVLFKPYGIKVPTKTNPNEFYDFDHSADPVFSQADLVSRGVQGVGNNQQGTVASKDDKMGGNDKLAYATVQEDGQMVGRFKDEAIQRQWYGFKQEETINVNTQLMSDDEWRKIHVNAVPVGTDIDTSARNEIKKVVWKNPNDPDPHTDTEFVVQLTSLYKENPVEYERLERVIFDLPKEPVNQDNATSVTHNRDLASYRAAFRMVDSLQGTNTMPGPSSGGSTSPPHLHFVNMLRNDIEAVSAMIFNNLQLQLNNIKNGDVTQDQVAYLVTIALIGYALKNVIR